MSVVLDILKVTTTKEVNTMTNTNNDLATRYECIDVDGFGGLFCLPCASIYAEERSISLNAENDDNAVAWASEDFYHEHEHRPCDSCGKE